MISLIPQFSIEVVQVLPTEDISDTTIYLVPAEDPEVGNYYEEYIHVNNTWDLVGSTAVDLSDYYTKAQADGKFAVTITNTISPTTTTKKVADIKQNNVRLRFTPTTLTKFSELHSVSTPSQETRSVWMRFWVWKWQVSARSQCYQYKTFHTATLHRRTSAPYREGIV